ILGDERITVLGGRGAVLGRTQVARSVWAACLVTALALHVPRQAPAPVAAAAPALQLIGPGRAEAPLVSLIDGARQRVLVEAFALSDTSVIAALQAAERRGVDVRVVLDPQGLDSAATLGALQSAGIRTRAPNPAYALTHLDEVVIDAGDVAVLTTALTADARVIASLRAARARRVVVRVLTPPSSNNAGLLGLVGRMGQVRFRDDGAGTLLVRDRRTVLLGSMDLTSSTLTAHRDLGIVLSG